MEPYNNDNGHHIGDEFFDLIYNNAYSICVTSTKGFPLSDEKTIHQLNNLKVKGIGGFKSHFKCYKTNYGYDQYYYLGRHKGYYYAHKEFRFHKPHLWLRKRYDTFSIIALAGLFPCADRISDDSNVFLSVDYYDPSKTLMKSSIYPSSSRKIDFYQSWPHVHYVDHGEWVHGNIYKYFKDGMKLSNWKRSWEQSFVKDKFEGTIIDEETTLQYDSTSKIIPIHSEFHMSNNYWDGSITMYGESSKDFIREFLPTNIPFFNINLPDGFHNRFPDHFKQIYVSYLLL